MDNEQHMPQPQGSPFLKKLGTYLFGVAIGFVILGWFQYKKSVAAQQQRQQMQEQGAGSTPPETRAGTPDDNSPGATEPLP